MAAILTRGTAESVTSVGSGELELKKPGATRPRLLALNLKDAVKKAGGPSHLLRRMFALRSLEVLLPLQLTRLFDVETGDEHFFYVFQFQCFCQFFLWCIGIEDFQ